MDSMQSEAAPTHAPAAIEAAPTAHAPVFYRLDSRRVTFIEFWWGMRSPLVVIAWLLIKVFRIQVPGSTDDPPVESLDDFEVFEDELPASARARLTPGILELQRLGFGSPIYHAIDDALHSTKTYLASFSHPRLPVVARLHNRVWSFRLPVKDSLFAEFITAYNQGGYLWTLSSKPDMKAPRSCRVQRRVNASVSDLWKLHEHAMASKPEPTLPAATIEQVRGICDGLHEEVRDFHLKRRVFAPLTAADQKQVAAKTSAAGLVEGGSQHPEIMAEIVRIQSKKTSWAGLIILLVLSIAVFLGVGVQGINKFGRLMALVPILLFHEGGHYIAMKAFGYRNLKMFFIPGFGAAVTGRSFNVPGWKKVVVSLAGPVPGIFVGIIMGIVGMVWKKPVLVDAAYLTVFLNGFNLIPVLPLDGGHILHQILFSRHHVMDILFRVFAAVALVVVSGLSGSRFFMFFAVGLFLTLPQMIRVAEVVRELKAEGFKPVSADDQTIPPAVAEVIIGKLKAKAKKPVPNKMVAEQTLQAFETMNTRPPGVLASLSLATVHLLSFTLALVFAIVFLMNQQGSFANFVQAAANRPQHSLSTSMIRHTAPPSAPVAAGQEKNTIVAMLAKRGSGPAEFEAVSQKLGPNERASLIGDTLLIQLPASDDVGRKKWLDELQPKAPDVFVQGKSMSAAFRFQAIAPTAEEAEAMERELQEYFRMPLSEGLIAPWSGYATITPEQQKARKTWARLESVERYDDPEVKVLRDKLLAALRRGDTAEAKSLGEQQNDLFQSLHKKRLKEVAEDTSDEVDHDLAKQYLALYESTKPEEFYLKARKELAPRLGQAAIDGKPDPAGDPASARGGYFERAGLLVQIEYVTFTEPGPGAAAMAEWLTRKKCISLHYDVIGEENYDEEMD